MKETNGQTLSKQQQKSLETKNRIFSAAKSILQRKGYDALSIKNICEEAGVSNGSFYHHFSFPCSSMLESTCAFFSSRFRR